MLDSPFYVQFLERLLAAHAAVVSTSLGSVRGPSLPESYGKRQRNQVKAKKATAREERRVARARRRAKVAPTDSGRWQSEELWP
jgi:hypothetical protein